MATPFPFPNKITRDIQHNLVVSEMSANFGDGYAQVGGVGITPVRDSISITIAPLLYVEMLEFEYFIASVGIWNTVSLTPPLEDTLKFYRITGNIRKEQIAKARWRFSLTLLEL